MTDHVSGSPDGRERRRAVRRPVDGQIASMPAVVSVRVMDISTGGVEHGLLLRRISE